MEGGESPVAFNCSCDPRQAGAGHSVRCMLAPLCWCSQERFPSCPEQGLIQAQPGTDRVPASRPVHGAKWDRHQGPRAGVVAAHSSLGSVVTPTFLLNPSSPPAASPPAQPQRRGCEPGVFNPAKPSLLIVPGRASSLPAVPAAGWMLLLFLSDLLSISSSARAQPPSQMLRELLERKGLRSLTLRTFKVLSPLLPSNSKVPPEPLVSPCPFHHLVFFPAQEAQPWLRLLL